MSTIQHNIQAIHVDKINTNKRINQTGYFSKRREFKII